MRLLLRGAGFLAGLAVLYVGSVGALTFVEFGNRTAMEWLLQAPLRSGQTGQSLVRFREIRSYRDVDVVFLGSSHAYRGFDPRIFAQTGLRTFNMGSSSQTPLNSRFLLKRYWDQLHPRLVVYEVYPRVHTLDGMESYYDLLSNTPMDDQTVRMALATRNVYAMNALISTQWKRLRRPMREREQREFRGSYIRGGYVESTVTMDTFQLIGEVPREWELEEAQLDHLRELIRFVEENGARIVLVTHPLPEETRQWVRNYDELSATFHELAEEEGVHYFDFNDSLDFDTFRHFYDWNHLNAEGVSIFNRALIDTLQARGYLAFRR
ncbi:MAG: hypothetical protein M3409_03905 [Gemmatimonadota bacterium]|jgi:hypothetical protein|nr:hypothetical protein [Gemmatimonadota bacterium]